MTSSSNRRALLGGAALGILSSFTAASPAQASCIVTATTVVCGPTTTTDTTNVGTTPAADRHYLTNTSASPFTGTVSSGALVDGFGLAFTNTVGGTNPLSIINSGTVQINAGNTATAGGNSVLQVTATGATPVNYSGEGNIINLGTVAGHGLDFAMQGTGDLNATVGLAGGATTTISTSAPNASAIQVNRLLGTAGNVSVTTTSDTTLRGTFAGINVDAAGSGTMTVNNSATIGSPVAAPNTLANGIRVVESATGTGAIAITNNGSIGAATDRVGTGITGQILNAASTANLSVQGQGAIFSSGSGIVASNAGTGTTTVNYTGAINTTGATGVQVTGTTGTTSVTTGPVTAATTAVSVTSVGPQTITANGVTTGTAGSGIVSNTTGLRTITVGSAGNVTGGTQAILLSGTGGASVTNNGVIGTNGGSLALNAATATAPVSVTNASGATLNGRLAFGSGADTLTNSGTFNTQGVTDFGAGTDTLTNNAGGVINLTGATTFANLENFNQGGTLQLNTFVLTGGPGTFTNAGTLNTTGTGAGLAGFTALNNTGTLNLAAGTFTAPTGPFTNSATGTVNAVNGATTINGQTTFNNSGTINLQDGATGDFLTINSNYVGSGAAALNIDSSATASDRLIITGGASGSTRVNANILSGNLINIPGNLVVDNGTSTANAFVLGTVTGNTSPLVNYALAQNGADYFLTSTPTAAAFDPMAVGNLASSIWYQSADEVQNQTDLPAVTVGASFWGQAYYSHDRVGDSDDRVLIQGTTFTVDNRVKTKRMGIQGGVDYGFGGARVGLTGGYGSAKTRNDLSSRLKATGWNAGLYGQFGGPVGFHGSALVKHDRYKLRFTDGAFDGERARLRANGIDGSLGYRFGMGGDAMFDAKVGLSHVRTKVRDIDAFGFNYDYGRMTSTRGRAGLRATFASDDLAPYIDASIHHEFNGQRNLRLFDGTNAYDLDTTGKGTWGRIEAGLTGRYGPGPLFAFWADVGDKRGFGARAGFRFGGRAAALVAEPIPMAAPPPPPPPATQTCMDGSVILATDLCPAPPPPPPEAPLPAPERG